MDEAFELAAQIAHAAFDRAKKCDRRTLRQGFAVFCSRPTPDQNCRDRVINRSRSGECGQDAIDPTHLNRARPRTTFFRARRCRAARALAAARAPSHRKAPAAPRARRPRFSKPGRTHKTRDRSSRVRGESSRGCLGENLRALAARLRRTARVFSQAQARRLPKIETWAVNLPRGILLL